MSEHLKNSSEHTVDNLDLKHESKENLERIQRKASEEKGYHDEVLKELERTVEDKAVSGQEITVGEKEGQSSQITPMGSQKALKEKAYKQGMLKIRQHLSPTERGFSRVIHQPVVQTVSEITAKTIGRPTGLLIGGLFALMGSVFVLFSAKYYGFEYNLGLFLLLFIIGYFVGLLGEMTTKLIHRK